ncbi:MAG: hypothetical protein ACRDNJ_00420 [Solirubrobacteraceae bacterium]
MKATALRTVGTAVVQRVSGVRPRRSRALAAAIVAGAMTAAGTYRVLRS